MELPELNNDILEYLEKFLRPKKYSLLNKFCRDIYFRKNGVRIRIWEKFRPTDLCTKYSVKILEMAEFVENIENFEELVKISKNVVYIECSYHTVTYYNKIVKVFPNLKKITYVVSDNNIDDLLKSTTILIKGVIVSVDKTMTIGNLEAIALKGLDLLIIDYDITRLPLIVREKIVGASVNFAEIPLDLCPNLRYFINGNNKYIEENNQKILEHPTLEKIIYAYNDFPVIITKKNGIRIKNYLQNEYLIRNEVDFNREKYEKIKTFYDKISTYGADILDLIIKYEKDTKNSKKMKLTTESGDIKKIKDLVMIFDLTLHMSQEDLKDCLINHELYKVKVEEDRLIMIFKIKIEKSETKKFRVIKYIVKDY